MKDVDDVLKEWVKNKMFDYELLIDKEGYTILCEKIFVCYSKNANSIIKAIQILANM